MNAQALSREIKELPSDVQREVLDFVEFLRSRYMAAGTRARKTRVPLSREPFIGVWKGRKDMSDGAQWVRGLRHREWG